jgi:hypothetical protein
VNSQISQGVSEGEGALGHCHRRRTQGEGDTPAPIGGLTDPRDDSEATRARRAAVQGTKAALDSLIQLVLDRRLAMRDIAWLRAAAAERSE